MTSNAHPDPEFHGPYFFGEPRLLGEELWRSEVATYGEHHPAAIIAGGWYAVGLGLRQTRDSLRLLREAEHWLRVLGTSNVRHLGINLAAQGFALIQLGSHGLAARRFREALPLLHGDWYEHFSDMMLIHARLAEAELHLYGPVAALERLHDGRKYQQLCGLGALHESVKVRTQLLSELHKTHNLCELSDYRGLGRYQRDTDELLESVSAARDAIDALLIMDFDQSARHIASDCMRWLLDNRNLTPDHIREALDCLASSLDALTSRESRQPVEVEMAAIA